MRPRKPGICAKPARNALRKLGIPHKAGIIILPLIVEYCREQIATNVAPVRVRIDRLAVNDTFRRGHHHRRVVCFHLDYNFLVLIKKIIFFAALSYQQAILLVKSTRRSNTQERAEQDPL